MESNWLLGVKTTFVACWVWGLVDGPGIVRHMVAQRQWTLMRLCHSVGESFLYFHMQLLLTAKACNIYLISAADCFPNCHQYRLKKQRDEITFWATVRSKIWKPSEFPTERNITDAGAAVLMPVPSILCYPSADRDGQKDLAIICWR